VLVSGSNISPFQLGVLPESPSLPYNYFADTGRRQLNLLVPLFLFLVATRMSPFEMCSRRFYRIAPVTQPLGHPFFSPPIFGLHPSFPFPLQRPERRFSRRPETEITGVLPLGTFSYVSLLFCPHSDVATSQAVSEVSFLLIWR